MPFSCATAPDGTGRRPCLCPTTSPCCCAPQLNPIENVRACLRANRLAISVFETCEDIVARCCQAWTFFAEDTAAVRSITNRDYAKTVST